MLPPEIRRCAKFSVELSIVCRVSNLRRNEFLRLNIVILCRELDLNGMVGMSRERFENFSRCDPMEQDRAANRLSFICFKLGINLGHLLYGRISFTRGLCKSPIALLVRLIEAALIHIRSHPSAKPYLMEPLAEAVLMFLCKLREQIKDNPFAISITEYRNLLRHLLFTLTHCESGVSASSSSHELRGSLYVVMLIVFSNTTKIISLYHSVYRRIL